MVDLVALDFGFIDGVAGSDGTSAMDSAVVMNISPSVVRTAYCRWPDEGLMVVDMICTSISFANTISPGRYGVEDNVPSVLGETVVIA